MKEKAHDAQFGLVNNYLYFCCAANNLKEARELACEYKEIFKRKYNIARINKDETVKDVINILSSYTREQMRIENLEIRRRVSVFILKDDFYLFCIHLDIIKELEAFKKNPLKLMEVVENVLVAYSSRCLSQGHIEQLRIYQDSIVEYIKSQN